HCVASRVAPGARNCAALCEEKRRMKGRWLFAGVALALGARTANAADAVLDAATDLPGTVMFMESHSPGMVLAVVRGDQQIIRGYGETAPGNKQEPDGNSLVRLNSITKVFTTEALAALAVDRKLSLADSLQDHLPGVPVPNYQGTPITLLDLATYTAALP